MEDGDNELWGYECNELWYAVPQFWPLWMETEPVVVAEVGTGRPGGFSDISIHGRIAEEGGRGNFSRELSSVKTPKSKRFQSHKDNINNQSGQNIY